MEFEKFQKMVSAPGKTKEDLMKILENTRSRGSAEHVAAVMEQLNSRFPGWEGKRPSRRGGATPNWPRFQSERASFETAKDGYIWLVEKLLKKGREVLSQDGTKLASAGLGTILARTPEELFPGSPHLSSDNSKYVRLSNGWVANVNLNNAQKFAALLRLGALAGAVFPTDWDWEVSGATELLANKQAAAIEAKRVWDELLAQFKL